MKEKLKEIIWTFMNTFKFVDHFNIKSSGKTKIEEYFDKHGIVLSNKRTRRKDTVCISNPYGGWRIMDGTTTPRYIHFPKDLAEKIVVLGKMP